jgi:hypothetical protein
MLTETPVFEDQAVEDQIERILHSEELRGSEVLRRLLRFLADKSASGEADDLKEYIVAIDGLGKPSTYDPRYNSAVRIQAGRLRQKLADYYRGEGLNDPILIDVPKGRFKLTVTHRAAPNPTPTPTQPAVHEHLPPTPAFAPTLSGPYPEAVLRNPRTRPLSILRPIPALALATVVVALAAGAYSWLRPFHAGAANVAYPAGWDADMEEVWRPLVETNRPLILAIEDPLFAELNGTTETYFRDRTLNNWKDISSSPTVSTLRKVLKSSAIQPSRHFTSFGEVDASFMIAKLLGPREQSLSVVRTSDFPLRMLADNNVLFVGVENLFFNEQTQAMPIEVQLQPVKEGIRNQRPAPGEPALFADQYSTAPTEEGVAFALVTHLPGPLRDSDVVSFTSSRSAGYVGAVKAFTDPVFVHTLAPHLRQLGGGRIPRYYQVLLKVRFQKEMPTEITYVLARELQ